MLVLALQFSKGIAGVGIVRTRSPGTPWQRSWRLVPCERGSPLRAGSLKTEEKTKFVELGVKEDGSYDFSLISTEPTNAPTGNWFEPGRTNAGQRLNSSSLERR